MISSKNKLNKSFSYPDISNLTDQVNRIKVGNNGEQNISKIVRVCVEEIYPGNSPLLMRKYSWEEMYSARNKRNYDENNEEVLNNISYLNLDSSLDHNKYCDQKNYVPMEVDSLNESNDYTSSEQERTHMEEQLNSVCKRKVRNLCTNEVLEQLPTTKSILIPTKTLKHNQSHTVLKYLLYLGLFATCIYVYFKYIDDTIYVNHEIQLANIKTDLKKLVHQQDAAVNIVISSLEYRNRWPQKHKVIGFIGTNGVGKTYVANIIKTHFHKRLVHELHATFLGKIGIQENVINQIHSSGCNLLIIDDLLQRDSESLFLFLKSLPEDKFVLIIVIYNIQSADNDLNYQIYYEDVSKIRKDFDASNMYNELVVFNEFDNNIAQNYLKKILIEREVETVKHHDIIKALLEEHKVQNHGLKGLYPKILLTLQKLNGL